ncbi:MAG: PKD domain-containing protein [Flavobacteriales bacterium]|nr:PKD domain-containing protein [Flavobacteriales bacterium]
MKKIKTLTLLLGLIFGIQTGYSQCQASFTSVDNGAGSFSFTNTSTGIGFNSSWSFGDGNNAWTTNSSNTYLNNGWYSVCLTIYDSINQCSSTFCDSIVVTGAINPCAGTIAGFTYVDNGGGNFSFTNTSTGIGLYSSWSFGDGNNAWTTNSSNTYLTNGAYSVCLTIYDSINQCQSTFCDNIVVTGVTNPCAGTVAGFTFVDNGSGNFSFTNTSTGGSLFSSWSFGDGNNASTANSSNTYLTNGAYSVCLTIYDSINQCQSVFCDSIVVTGSGAPCAVVAGFNVVDNGGGNYTFNNTSTGSGLTYYWNFGDGNSSSNASPNHTYLADGVYAVQLYAFDPIDSNCYDFTVITINVAGVLNPIACQAGFIIFPDSSSGNVIIINSSTGNNLTYFWDFGDGNNSTLAYPNYTYTTSGPFSICLTVSDSNNFCTSTYCDSINSGGLVLKQTGFTINIQAPVITGIVEDIELISEFNVYPNPVKNNLTIELNLNEQAHVKVFVTDILGNRVAQINDEELNSGTNTLKWNSNKLSNGIYLLNIETNNSLQVKKLILN